MATRGDDKSDSFATLKYQLNNTHKMPAVGLGTYRIKSQEEMTMALDHALAAGYRLFDTATVYHNEALIQEAFKHLLPKYDLDRDDIFITTKLSTADHGPYHVVEKAYRNSLERLGVDYVDLYLIHFPGKSQIHKTDVRNKKFREDTWSAMENLYDLGLVNAIGVANFTVRHLEELMQNKHTVMPAVNQVEFHPYYNQNELLKYCKANDIVVQAYSSLGGTSQHILSLMNDKVIKKIARKYCASSAQVLLLWALQKDIAVIPKSVNPIRIKENITLTFRLTERDMQEIDALGSVNVKYAWDPQTVF